MFSPSIPATAQQVLLQDAAQRDIATRRRMAILSILLRERYLTREQLVFRIEGMLWRGCFGAHAWEDTFYRDARVVKEALLAAGYQLQYSRKKDMAGYCLKDQPALSPELEQAVKTSLAEANAVQLAIFRGMSPYQRFRLGASVSDAAHKVVAYQIGQKNEP